MRICIKVTEVPQKQQRLSLPNFRLRHVAKVRAGKVASLKIGFCCEYLHCNVSQGPPGKLAIPHPFHTPTIPFRDGETTIKIKFAFLRVGDWGQRGKLVKKNTFGGGNAMTRDIESADFIVAMFCCHRAGSSPYPQPFRTPSAAPLG